MSDISFSSSESGEPNVDNEEEEKSESNTIDGPNPYEIFNSVFVNDSFLKSNTILQFAKSLHETIINELSSITNREDFIKYVEAIFRHLRLNPQKFIFFMSKPEPSSKEEKELILIKSDRKLFCIRKNSTYMLKGHIVNIFFKNQSRIQVTTSKGLFLKLTIWKDLKYLKAIIPDFLNLTQNPTVHGAEELFFKSMMDLPNKFFVMNHVIKNSFLSLFLTANLEFCRKLVLCKIKEENLFNISKDIMIIFQKSHLWDHLMRVIIPLYIEKQVNHPETIMADFKIYLVPCLLNLCRLHYGKKFLPQVSKILRPVICQRNIDEYVILTFIQLVFNMNFPSQILLIATELYKAVKSKYPDDEYAAPSVVGSFLITDFIFPEIYNTIADDEEKRRYLTFLNVLTFNQDFNEGQHFFEIIKKLYIALGESEVIVTKITSADKQVFSYHISNFFDFLQENASSLYSQFQTIDLSCEKSPVYKEVMQLFEYAEILKSGQKIGNEEDYEEQLIIELNQIHKKIKNGQIKIKRTQKKDVRKLVKKQKQEKKNLLAEIKSKKTEKKKKEKLEKKDSEKSKKKKKNSQLSEDESSEGLNNDEKSELEKGEEKVSTLEGSNRELDNPEHESGSEPDSIPKDKPNDTLLSDDSDIKPSDPNAKKISDESGIKIKSSIATSGDTKIAIEPKKEDGVGLDLDTSKTMKRASIFHNSRKPKEKKKKL